MQRSSAEPLPLGQVYYTLVKEREARGIKDIAISRIEQLSPFPYDLVRTSTLKCPTPNL